MPSNLVKRSDLGNSTCTNKQPHLFLVPVIRNLHFDLLGMKRPLHLHEVSVIYALYKMMHSCAMLMIDMTVCENPLRDSFRKHSPVTWTIVEWFYRYNNIHNNRMYFTADEISRLGLWYNSLIQIWWWLQYRALPISGGPFTYIDLPRLYHG